MVVLQRASERTKVRLEFDSQEDKPAGDSITLFSQRGGSSLARGSQMACEISGNDHHHSLPISVVDNSFCNVQKEYVAFQSLSKFQLHPSLSSHNARLHTAGLKHREERKRNNCVAFL